MPLLSPVAEAAQAERDWVVALSLLYGWQVRQGEAVQGEDMVLESVFRLFSICVLGVLALAATLSLTRAPIVAKSPIKRAPVYSQIKTDSLHGEEASIQMQAFSEELSAAREVEQINAGKFQPWMRN